MVPFSRGIKQDLLLASHVVVSSISTISDANGHNFCRHGLMGKFRAWALMGNFPIMHKHQCFVLKMGGLGSVGITNHHGFMG